MFPAAGVLPDETDKAEIAATTARWQFRYGDDEAQMLHAAIHAAPAAFIRSHTDELGDGAPHTTTQLAVTAVEVHELFVGPTTPSVDAVRVALRRR